MKKLAPFTVYDASAGSGKTFAITKRYLSLLLLANRPDAYRNILAITFTNKAVEEMKSRVINALSAFSEEKTPKGFGELLKEVSEETNLSEKIVKEKSQRILKTLLHDYSSFVISTIDAFTNRVLRTFAKDLGLQMNYEVEIDSASILSEAVGRVISQAGEDKELTKSLIDFALSKADDEKSWNIEYDLNEIAKLLVNENNRFPLAVLSKKTLADFREFSEKLKNEIAKLKKDIAEKTESFFQIIQENGLDESCFTRKSLPNYFLKLRRGKGFSKINFNNVGWQEKIAEEALYTKTFLVKSPEKAETIDRLQPEIASLFLGSKQAVLQLFFYKKIHDNLIQLSLMGHIRQEAEEIKKERNLLLISDFNEKIAQSIQGQPVPFIYERLGERYRDYFIDEFQDTSTLQWENLMPLVSNWLSGEDEKQRAGSLVVVGDAKQAIYRWRGGKAEQFIALCEKKSPFPGIEIGLQNLPSNYRSKREIVEFNNAFFQHTAKYLNSDIHRKLFENAGQEVKKNSGGYVNISFIEKPQDKKDKAGASTPKEEKTQAYAKKVLETITHLTTNNYPKNEICVLVRKKDEGIAIADVLSENGIEIISSESLLVGESPKVKFLNNLLQFSINPSNDELKLELLYFLWENHSHILVQAGFFNNNPHAFLSEGLSQKGKHFYGFLNHVGFSFDLAHFQSLPLYDAVEYAVRKFKLISENNAYLQFYLDFVLNFSRKKSGGIPGFLEHWELHEKKLSITAPEGKDAVRIMTIHKSKGLEFPIVIYPFADNAIDEINKKESVWIPLEEKLDFPYSYLNANSKLLDYGENSAAVFQKLMMEKELDAMNVLYVALTRAKNQLFIISQLESPRDGNTNPHKYSHFFIEFLKSMGDWKEGVFDYGIGEFKSNTEISLPNRKALETKFISTDPSSHGLELRTELGSLWQSVQEEAIGRGTILHEILSMIDSKKQAEPVLRLALKNGLVSDENYAEYQNIIFEILNHPQLKEYFEPGNMAFNEKEILWNGKILRPDRINFEGGMAVIIDYKTGIPMETHEHQINHYAEAVSAIGFQIKEKLLVYVNSKTEIRRILP